MHLPYSLYSYLTVNFIDWVCQEPGTIGNPKTMTSLITPLYSCQCEGTNYYGMPEISLDLVINGYPVNYAYKMSPADYELFPSVNYANRVPQCALSIWNNGDTKDYVSN